LSTLRREVTNLNAETRKMKIICVVCPISCNIEVTLKGDEILNVKNNLCERGKVYAIEEITTPKRMLTTTVNVKKGHILFLPVKTATPIPKDLIFPCMEVLKDVIVKTPIHKGNVIVKNILGKGINVVSSRSVELMKI